MLISLQLPTVMAKILGVYRLSVKNIQTGKVQKMDVLVMENIYYGKTITRQYDLKGSLRNRHVEVSDSKTCVLLDENLIESKQNSISALSRLADSE
jgi:1-phosphatidylinositol-3-phosphate 5-kinase